jgi:alpha-L-fucosidase
LRIKRLTAFCALLIVLAWPATGALGATPEDLQKWQKLRYGLFIHWGIYSVPAGVWNDVQIEKLGEQIQRHADIPSREYAELSRQFNPTAFDADAIARLAKDAGMKYIVLTAKHHDGFAMFDSSQTDFDIIDATPFGRDVVLEMAQAARAQGLKFGVYYSIPDWHHSGPDPERNPLDGKLSVFAEVSPELASFENAQVEELLTQYGEITEVFFDMGEPTPAQSREFRETVKRIQPGTIVNGRVMNSQGDIRTLPDNALPDLPLTDTAWETPGNLYPTWGFKSWVTGPPVAEQVRTQARRLATVAGLGGNFLLNIGPKADGSVPAYEADVLHELGKWVRTHQKALFDVGTNPFGRLDFGQATTGDEEIFLFLFDRPANQLLVLDGLKTPVSAISLNGSDLGYSQAGDRLEIRLEGSSADAVLDVVTVKLSAPPRVNRPALKFEPEGHLLITDKQAFRHAAYGDASYRTIRKDARRSWKIDIPEPGKYRVSLRYKLKDKEKGFRLASEDDELSFDLEQQNDGKPFVAGELSFARSGEQLVWLCSELPPSFHRQLEAFHAAGAKVRSLRIELEWMKFERMPVN